MSGSLSRPTWSGSILLAVAKAIPSLAELDIEHYCRIVDGWTEQFARWLPDAERSFQQTPWKWKSDLRFFRVGMLAGFLGHEIGIRYSDEQKHAQAVRYTNPSDLFLNGLIDTKQGTCANMPTLHAAIARRMGWPVSLAAVKSHLISRYDDGEVYHNIEATSVHPGSFASDPDEVYIKRFQLPKKAITSGSDLRRLSAAEMVGIFVSLRARHFCDVDNWEQADLDYTLARVLAPTHRRTYIGAMPPMLETGRRLFEPIEVGHPNSLGRIEEPEFIPVMPDNAQTTPRLYVMTTPFQPPAQAVRQINNGQVVFSMVRLMDSRDLAGPNKSG